MPKGRPRKEVTTVTLPNDEFQLIVDRLGYKCRQDLIDNLAMGIIPPIASPVAPPAELPTVEGSGKSTEVTCSKSETGLAGKGSSWANEMEATDSAAKQKELVDLVDSAPAAPVAGSDSKEIPPSNEPGGNPKTWSEVLAGNRTSEKALCLEYIQPSSVVKITDDEWEEGARIWQFPILVTISNTKPTYTEMLRWVTVNWAKFNPKLSQLKAGIFLVEFSTEEERMGVLCKNWTYYHKYSVIIKP